MSKARVTSSVISKGDTKKLLSAIDKLNVLNVVKVGVPMGASPAPDGTPMAMIGAVHEFGDPPRGVPERSWLRRPVRENKLVYVRLNRINILKVLLGEMTMNQALDLLGQTAVGHVKTFLSTNDYQLKQSTIDRKGSSQALIDEGNLRGSVNHVIEE